MMEDVNNVSATIFWDCILIPESGVAKYAHIYSTESRLLYRKNGLNPRPRKELSRYTNWVNAS